MNKEQQQIIGGNSNEIKMPSDSDIRYYKALANWIIGPITEYINKNGYKTDIIDKIIRPDKLYDLVTIVEFTDLIDFSTAKRKVLPLLINNFTNETVWDIITKENLLDKLDDDKINLIIDEVLIRHSDKVNQYKTGKLSLMSMFIGEIMKMTKGKVKPQIITEILHNKLKN
jgi:aspartyl-tRNA(Asn)/glutamyl-tRNA(Gln) amidotransferase subunit B